MEIGSLAQTNYKDKESECMHAGSIRNLISVCWLNYDDVVVLVILMLCEISKASINDACSYITLTKLTPCMWTTCTVQKKHWKACMIFTVLVIIYNYNPIRSITYTLWNASCMVGLQLSMILVATIKDLTFVFAWINKQKVNKLCLIVTPLTDVKHTHVC